MENTNPKIAIIGYGSMGKEIERIAREQGIEVTDIFELDSKLDAAKNYDFDVAIDFSFPDQVMENLKAVTALKKNLVLGTTGWYERKEEVAKIVEAAGTGFIWGSNFSIGVNMFFKIIEQASKVMNKVNGYDVFVHETHHKRKKDSPSGTALSIADIITKNVDSKNRITADKIDRTIEADELHVSSTRGGEVTGTHSVILDSFADEIELTHRAKNRTGFAMGAVEAAKWIHGKKGFYSVEDMLNSLLED